MPAGYEGTDNINVVLTDLVHVGVLALSSEDPVFGLVATELGWELAGPELVDLGRDLLLLPARSWKAWSEDSMTRDQNGHTPGPRRG